MFERFTERARQVVILAQEESRNLGYEYIGTGHVLLGLLREEEGLAARVLENFDMTVEKARELLLSFAPPANDGQNTISGQIPFTPRAKKALELSLREALSLGHNYIGTEHILLGLIREDESTTTEIFNNYDIDAEVIRHEVIRMLSGPGKSIYNQQMGASADAADSHEYELEVSELILRAVAIGRGVLLIDEESVPQGDPFDFGDKLEIIVRKVQS